MRELMLNVGLILALIGMFAYFVLGFFYIIWRPYRKKTRLSRKDFTKAVWLASIATVMIGFGFGITVASDQEG